MVGIDRVVECIIGCIINRVMIICTKPQREF